MRGFFSVSEKIMGDCFSKSSSRFVCSFSMALVIEGLLGGYSFTFLMAVCITPRISIILCCISASAIQFLPFPKYYLIIENECLCVKVKLCLKDHVVYRLLCLGVGKMPQDFVLFFGRQYFKGRDNIFRNGAQRPVWASMNTQSVLPSTSVVLSFGRTIRYFLSDFTRRILLTHVKTMMLSPEKAGRRYSMK